MLERSRYRKSQELFQRAQETIPGGIHLSGRPLLDPERSPLYFERGKGCRIWDVDGNEYVDFLMAYGAFLIGYADERIDAAAFMQASRGNLLSLNHPMHLRFVDALLARFPSADMAAFFKTGSEATTVALRLARRFTGRRKVARCGYHGWHDWCVPEDDFVPAGLAAQVLEFRAREPASLAAIFHANPGEIAAVILAPEMLYPTDRATFHELARLTRDAGAVFVLDEVKTAFRIRPGSMQHLFGLDPDLTTVSKALGNGWPVAAVLGKRDIMRAGSGMHYSATYHGETAAMAAALKTLEIIDTCDVQNHVWHLGERLIDGLNDLARSHRLPAEAYGEPLPPMPFFRFNHPKSEVTAALRTTFYEEVLARGILFHPRHLWFLSLAHTAADIERALAVADEAMAITRTKHVRLLE